MTANDTIGIELMNDYYFIIKRVRLLKFCCVFLAAKSHDIVVYNVICDDEPQYSRSLRMEWHSCSNVGKAVMGAIWVNEVAYRCVVV